MRVLRERKCVRMIQPVSAYSPRAGFRGNKGTTYGKPTKGLSNKNIALINAGGVAVAAGGLGTALARSQTSSWAHAGVLGLCAAFLTMFFMTPQLIDKSGIHKLNNSDKSEMVAKEETPKFVDAIKEHLRPAKKLVQFKQQQA